MCLLGKIQHLKVLNSACCLRCTWPRLPQWLNGLANL